METILIWFISYLVGCIPFGVIFARTKKVDLRDHGSGNIGATNVARTLGKTLGVLTLAGDASKGLFVAFMASQIFENPIEIAISGFLTFLGHVNSIFLKFKGGKGVATGLGVFIFLMPFATLASIGIFAGSLWVLGYVSTGSILAAMFLPWFGIFFNYPPAFVSASLVVALIVAYKHYGNLQRIQNGTEPKLMGK